MMLIYELSVENFCLKFVFLSFVHDQKFYLLHRMNRVVFEVFFDMAAWQRNTFLRRTDLNWNTLIEYRRGKTKKAPASLTTHVHTHPTATKLIAEKVTCLGIQIHVWAAWGRLRLQLYSKIWINKSILIISINPQAPVAQKVADEVVFRRFQGEGVEFF